MEQITTIPDLIDLWRTTPLGRERGANNAFAHDLGVDCVVVRSMRLRKAVYVKYWPTVIAAAKQHARDGTTSKAFATINADLLLRLHTSGTLRRPKRRPAAA